MGLTNLSKKMRERHIKTHIRGKDDRTDMISLKSQKGSRVYLVKEDRKNIKTIADYKTFSVRHIFTEQF